MAVKIPQNVDIEDKLVGPLTLKQFLYILGGGALIFIAYQSFIEGYLYMIEFILVAFIIAGLTISLAFVKINGQPFIKFMQNVLIYIFTPKLRFWKAQNKFIVSRLKIRDKKTQEQLKQPKKDKSNHGKVEKLARILDTGGKINPDDNTETHEIDTLEQSKPDSQDVEASLGVEDVLTDTD